MTVTKDETNEKAAPEAETKSCCSASEASSCCDPKAKSSCCGPEAKANEPPTSCGCR
ncbi:MAG: hypothetical protein ACXWP4_03485 [Polyangiales bacterium]